MLKPIFIYFQYLLPQHLLTYIAGWLAESTYPALKTLLIHQFIKTYKIDMHLAIQENPDDYATFNAFFTRELKKELRPIAQAKQAIASPVDGCVAEAGQIRKNQLLQAKNFYFDLDHLLGKNDECIAPFYDGFFATFYLAPDNYHRVHMPLAGKLHKSCYIPGKLFSVNRMTTDLIPDLYSRNERYIAFFTTEVGPMAIILVGALLVGNIHMVWQDKPARHKKMMTEIHEAISFAKGQELGHFKMGSTVILLFPPTTMQWAAHLIPAQSVKMGELIGTTHSSHFTHVVPEFNRPLA